MSKKYESDKVLQAYVTMLLDGTAFSNWKYKPNDEMRYEIVESLIKDKLGYEYIDLRMNEIKKVKNEEELDKLLNEWEIKEDDFKI